MRRPAPTHGHTPEPGQGGSAAALRARKTYVDAEAFTSVASPQQRLHERWADPGEGGRGRPQGERVPDQADEHLLQALAVPVVGERGAVWRPQQPLQRLERERHNRVQRGGL